MVHFAGSVDPHTGPLLIEVPALRDRGSRRQRVPGSACSPGNAANGLWVAAQGLTPAHGGSAKPGTRRGSPALVSQAPLEGRSGAGWGTPLCRFPGTLSGTSTQLAAVRTNCRYGSLLSGCPLNVCFRVGEEIFDEERD